MRLESATYDVTISIISIVYRRMNELNGVFCGNARHRAHASDEVEPRFLRWHTRRSMISIIPRRVYASLVYSNDIMTSIINLDTPRRFCHLRTDANTARGRDLVCSCTPALSSVNPHYRCRWVFLASIFSRENKGFCPIAKIRKIENFLPIIFLFDSSELHSANLNLNTEKV